MEAPLFVLLYIIIAQKQLLSMINFVVDLSWKAFITHVVIIIFLYNSETGVATCTNNPGTECANLGDFYICSNGRCQRGSKVQWKWLFL